MSVIPDKYRDLLDGANFAHLATVTPEGSPQVNPVWFEYDGEFLTFNTAKGRQKDKNLRHNPKVALSILDPKNSYRYLEIRGEIVETTEEGAAAMIDRLAKRYMGVEKYPYHNAKEVRVTYKVKPLKANGMG